MLILIGTVPTAYALNHAITPQQSAEFVAISQQAANVLDKYVSPGAVVGDPRDDVTAYVRTKEFTPNTMLALRSLINGISTEVVNYKELRYIPQDQVRNFRNDMYLVSEALRHDAEVRTARNLGGRYQACWPTTRSRSTTPPSSSPPG